MSEVPGFLCALLSDDWMFATWTNAIAGLATWHLIRADELFVKNTFGEGKE